MPLIRTIIAMYYTLVILISLQSLVVYAFINNGCFGGGVCNIKSRSISSPSKIVMKSLPVHLQCAPLPPPPTTKPSIIQSMQLKIGYGKSLRERTVHTYFHGVHTKNISQITNCFSNEGCIIRDVCALTNKDVDYEELSKLVMPEFLGERCNEFLMAHPDAVVKFHYGPTCGRGRNNNWVYAHWYEEGSFSGKSQCIEPDGSPLTVQGQTRFHVNNDLKIDEIVITRTFSKWEEQLLVKNK